MKIIQVRDLRKTYLTYERGSSFLETVKSLVVRKPIAIDAVKGITFNVEQGELLGFLGPNGAGKSTTLKILTGVLFPTAGEVDILGFTPWRQRRKYVANIGAVFGQKSQLIWDIPPLDSFIMNKAIYEITDSDFKKRLEEMINLLGVEGVIRKPTRQLSLGERMKCEFIMAMLHNPKIVFLDEPTIGLDVIAKDRIRQFILDRNRTGTTFILTTHDLDDVERLARRVIVVNHGEIVFDDGLEALHGFSGHQKFVSLSTQKPLPDFTTMPGVTVTGQPSQYNAELELDMGKIELNCFIQAVNESYVINDLTIGEPPIENIIKELYMKKNE